MTDFFVPMKPINCKFVDLSIHQTLRLRFNKFEISRDLIISKSEKYTFSECKFKALSIDYTYKSPRFHRSEKIIVK